MAEAWGFSRVSTGDALAIEPQKGEFVGNGLALRMGGNSSAANSNFQIDACSVTPDSVLFVGVQTHRETRL